MKPLGGYYVQPQPAPPEPEWAETGFNWQPVFDALDRRALREAALESIQTANRRRPPCQCATCGNQHHPTRLPPPRQLGRALPPHINRSTDPAVIAADPDRAIPEPSDREKRAYAAMIRNLPHLPKTPCQCKTCLADIRLFGPEEDTRAPEPPRPRPPTFRMEEQR